MTGWPQAFYFLALLIVFVAVGAASLVPDLAKPLANRVRWLAWLLPVVDLALVTFAVIYPNPFGSYQLQSLPLVLQSQSILYLVFFIGLSALTGSPLLVLWTGVVAALMWTLASIWVAALPGNRWGTMGADPDIVMSHVLIQEVFLLLVIAALIAGAASRARHLVGRQVQTERQRTQLARYFSANMVDELASDDRAFTEVRKETVAVLFVDIVGFTGLSEHLDPETLIGIAPRVSRPHAVGGLRQPGHARQVPRRWSDGDVRYAAPRSS